MQKSRRKWWSNEASWSSVSSQCRIWALDFSCSWGKGNECSVGILVSDELRVILTDVNFTASLARVSTAGWTPVPRGSSLAKSHRGRSWWCPSWHHLQPHPHRVYSGDCTASGLSCDTCLTPWLSWEGHGLVDTFSPGKEVQTPRGVGESSPGHLGPNLWTHSLSLWPILQWSSSVLIGEWEATSPMEIEQEAEEVTTWSTVMAFPTHSFQARKRLKSLKMNSNKCLEKTKT